MKKFEGRYNDNSALTILLDRGIKCIYNLYVIEINYGDELNKPMASVQILLLLYTIYNMYITCMLLK